MTLADMVTTCHKCGNTVIDAPHDGPPAIDWTLLDIDPIPPDDTIPADEQWWPTSRGWTFGVNNRATYIYRTHRCGNTQEEAGAKA